MEKLTLMGEHYVCEVHLSSHTLDLSWECSSHWSGRVEGVLSLRKLAWPRASLVPPSRTIVSLFSFRHTTSPCHLPRCPRIAPRKETASLRAPFSPVVPTAIPSSDSAPARARPAPQIQNPLRAAVSAASPPHRKLLSIELHLRRAFHQRHSPNLHHRLFQLHGRHFLHPS